MHRYPFLAIVFLPFIVAGSSSPTHLVARSSRQVSPATPASGLTLRRRSSPRASDGETPSDLLPSPPESRFSKQPRPTTPRGQAATTGEPDVLLHHLHNAQAELADPSVPRDRRPDAAQPPDPRGGRDRWGEVRAELPHGQGGRYGVAPPVARRLAAQLRQREAIRRMHAWQDADHEMFVEEEAAAERRAMEAAEAVARADQRQREMRKREKKREKNRKRKEKEKAKSLGEGKGEETVGKEVEEQGMNLEGLHLIDTRRREPTEGKAGKDMEGHE